LPTNLFAMEFPALSRPSSSRSGQSIIIKLRDRPAALSAIGQPSSPGAPFQAPKVRIAGRSG
jgi:hypothetical protein